MLMTSWLAYSSLSACCCLASDVAEQAVAHVLLISLWSAAFHRALAAADAKLALNFVLPSFTGLANL